MKTIFNLLLILHCGFQHSVQAEESVATIPLSGTDWRIHEDADGQGVARKMFNADPTAAGWLPATVPGNIQADLEAVRRVPPYWFNSDDPLLADPGKWALGDWWNRRNFSVLGGDPRMADVARKDWWYRKDFAVPQSFAGKRGKLVFDGVDHECEVWLNGEKLGGHGGMYRQVGYEVGSALRPGQVNRLAVRIARMPPSLDEHIGMPSQIKAYRHELSEIKCPSYGLDWGIGVYSLGIWKDVRLEASGPARIDYAQVQTRLEEPWRTATVVTRLEIDSLKQLGVTARFRIEGHGAGVSKDVPTTLAAGSNQIEASLDLSEPALWWPSGQGSQPLYQLVAELVDSEGTLLHRRTTRFGVRDLQWVGVEGNKQDAGVRSQLVVNGRKVRLLGSNLINVDQLPGRQHAKADWLLRMAQAAGMNAVRLWGGGVTMRDGWYDLADELGIMIQHDLPTTNSGEPWPEEYSSFTAALERTTVSILKQLRNHACIVEWTGGNEMGWPKNSTLIQEMLAKRVAELDGRMFRPRDPAPGWRHGPYKAGPDNFIRNYNMLSVSRVTEFGSAGPANLETWHRDIPPSSQWPLRPDDPVLIAKNIVLGWTGDTWLQPKVIEAQFGKLPDLASLVKAGQWISADQLRYAIDSIRRNGTRTSGLFNWVFNEPWRNGAGNTMVDYDGRPLMNYYMYQQALAPVSLSLKYNSVRYKPNTDLQFEVWLTSDAPAPATGLSWRVLARDRNGKVFATRQGKTEINPLEVKQLEAITLAIPASIAIGPIFVEAQLLDSEGKTMQERLQIFGSDQLISPFRGLLDGEAPPAEGDGPLVQPSVSVPPAKLKKIVSSPAVARTTLEVSSLPMRVEEGQEVFSLRAKNTGNMTALFCIPHPLAEYRTDLFIDPAECFIPPGESRTITIRSDVRSDGGLSLAETGWRLASWNADDAIIEPDQNVLLAVGRRDQMCREFLGYFDKDQVKELKPVTLSGTRPDSSVLPYRLDAQGGARFEFDATKAQAKRPLRLRLHTADQSKDVPALVQVTVNGKAFDQALPPGLGLQRTDPAHLAFATTLTFEIPSGLLQSGKNVMEIQVKNGGWFTWDALDLTEQE